MDLLKNWCLSTLAMGLCYSINAQTTIQFNIDQPESPLSVEAGDNQGYNGIGSVVLGSEPTATGADGNYTFNWTPAQYLDDPNSSNPMVLSLDGQTVFTVSVAADGALCEKSDTVLVDYTVGINQADQIQVIAFPNPFTDIVRINSELPLEQITIHDVAGNSIVVADKNAQNNNVIDTQNLEAGMYFFTFKFTNGNQKTLKLCKLY